MGMARPPRFARLTLQQLPLPAYPRSRTRIRAPTRNRSPLRLRRASPGSTTPATPSAPCCNAPWPGIWRPGSRSAAPASSIARATTTHHLPLPPMRFPAHTAVGGADRARRLGVPAVVPHLWRQGPIDPCVARHRRPIGQRLPGRFGGTSRHHAAYPQFAVDGKVGPRLGLHVRILRLLLHAASLHQWLCSFSCSQTLISDW